MIDDERSTEDTESKEGTKEMLATKVVAKEGVEKAIIDLLKKALDKKIFDAVLIPHSVPSGDSFVYLLIQDPSVLTNTSPMAPVMPTQGARALSSVTRLDVDNLKLAAVMRPCEVRAAVELSKLDQSLLDDVTLISFDCPGVLPTKVFIEDPKKGLEKFWQGMKESSYEAMRPVCQMCDKAYSAFGDLHIGRFGIDEGSIFVIQRTQKGGELLGTLDMNPDVPVDDWKANTEEIAQARQTKRKDANKKLMENKLGLDNLLDTFSTCLRCHNCMRVCPMDYCQLCYFESDDMKYSPDEYFSRASQSGSLRFPTDTLQYHLGRMLHMSMSCVSCGTCEDACPMSIPVAQIYSKVAGEVQELFNYLPGSDPSEPRPFNELES
jgi:formate dehydrogenase subunit beta